MLSLWKTRLRVEKFVYEKGTNVALYVAEHSEPYQEIKKEIEQSLNEQIAHIATKEKVDTLLLFTKAANQDLITQVGLMLGQKTLANDIDFSIYLVWAGTQGGQSALDKLGIEGLFQLKNKDLINYFDDYSNLTINSVDDYTKKWIAGKIQEGKNKLLTPQQITDSLIDEGKGISKLRAERITLTETAKAMTTVELEAAKRYGIMEKIWRTSRDDRVDPICLDLAGKSAPIDGSFVGGYEGPPAHVSCRCFIEEVIPDGWVLPDKVWLGD